MGKHMLLRLMNDWKLLDELGVLRAIYLLGSGKWFRGLPGLLIHVHYRHAL